MERLVYAPKVQAYVQTSDGVIDLTEYIVSGSVTRQLNAVSTAELVIQNPHKQFTKPGHPTFRPMDTITIFLSRFRRHPVQVFTGYLDQTPYLQLHPGTCTLAASCTLKRLLYTYWDPGIPFTRRFLNDHGWLTDKVGGTVYKPSKQKNDVVKNQDKEEQDEAPQINDGSIGRLIYLVLRQVGNWDEQSIYVEQMPKGISDTIEELWESLRDDDEQLKKEVDEFLVDMIGPYAQGGAGPGSDGSPTTGSASIKDAPQEFQDFPRKATYTQSELGDMFRAGGMPGDIDYAVGIVWCESSGDTKAWSGLSDACCHGLWQLFLGNSPLDNDVFSNTPEGKANAQDPLISTWNAIKYFKNGGSWYPWDCATGRR